MNAAQRGSRKVSPRVLWTITAAILAGAILIALVAAEVATRLLQRAKHGTVATIERQYTIDPRLSLRVPIANLRAGPIETNSLGFRGPEIRVPKPSGTVRIAFLGASTTWCAEVSGNDATWPSLVADDLRNRFGGADVDFVNGGVPGYTARSSLKNLELRVAPLEPDIIVIYHATNDMSAELRALAAARGLTRQAQPEAPSWLASRFLLWDLAEKNWRIWLAQRKAEANVDRLEVDPALMGSQFRRDLTALVLAAKAKSNAVALATFSTRLRAGQDDGERLKAAASALYYMPFMTPDGLLASYARYNDLIREVARDTGAILIDGEHDIPGDDRHFTDSVHFTDDGSRAMAVSVANALAADPMIRSMF